MSNPLNDPSAAAARRAEFEENTRKQMLEEPVYWPFMFAHAYGSIDDAGGFDETGNIKNLSRAQTVLYLSAISAVLAICQNKILEGVKTARERAVIGGWVAKAGDETDRAETYLLLEKRTQAHPKTEVSLIFSHPAEPTAILFLNSGLDSGTYGMDSSNARVYLPEGYYETSTSLLLPEGITTGMPMEIVEEADPSIGLITANARIGKESGRDGWGTGHTLKISKTPIDEGLPEGSLSDFHVTFSSFCYNRML